MNSRWTTGMPAMKAGRLFLLIAGCLLLATVACSDDDDKAPALDDPSVTGEDLVDKYMTLLATNDGDGLDDFLSEAYLRQGAEGGFYTKDEYLKDPPHVSNYRISEVTARQDGDALVVRWMFSVTETVEGRPLSTAPAPRLATFIWDEGEWRLLSHANFNAPVQP